MKTELQKIGLAHAVIIPEAFLTKCGITKILSVHLENNRIVIESLKPPRLNWFENYHAEQDDDVWQGLSPACDNVLNK